MQVSQNQLSEICLEHFRLKIINKKIVYVQHDLTDKYVKEKVCLRLDIFLNNFLNFDTLFLKIYCDTFILNN